MTSLEVKVNQLVEENAALSRIVTQLKVALHQSQVDHATTKRQYILMGSGLSEQSCERLNRAFGNSTDNGGLKEAINCERRMPMSKQDARVKKILGGAQ
jgi:hypothetical protein